MSFFHALLVVAPVLSSCVHGFGFRKPRVDWPNLKARQLSASPITADLKSRDGAFTLHSATTLRYISYEEEDPAVLIHITSDTPFLDLERNEDHLEDVTCDTTGIEIRFTSPDTFAAAKRDLNDVVGSYAVTSHDGCNKDGAHGAHHVKDVLFDEKENIARLLTEPAHMRVAFPNFTFAFEDEQPLAARAAESRRLQRRKDLLPADIIDDVPANRGNISTSDVEKTDSYIATKNVSAGLVDQDLPLPPPLDALPIGFKCKNCSTFGTAKFKRGAFNFDTPTIQDPVSLTGSLMMTLNDFSAIVELENTLSGATYTPERSEV